MRSISRSAIRPGLEISGERTARIPAVDAGQSYPFKVQVRGATAGIYYISVLAKVSTKVQTEARAFTIPVVIGTPTAAAAQKPAAQTDASGQPIESMPAKENKEYIGDAHLVSTGNKGERPLFPSPAGRERA